MCRPSLRSTVSPVDVICEGDIPEGKLDLMMSIDFRMTSTTLASDVVLPAATWYEKADISSTDMHPYVHAFSAATDPPWETRSDFDVFGAIARAFTQWPSSIWAPAAMWCSPRCSTTHRTRWPIRGTEEDWLHTGATPVPGRTMAKLTVVERDYTAIYDKWLTLGPLVDKFGVTTKGVTVHPFREVENWPPNSGS